MTGLNGRKLGSLALPDRQYLRWSGTTSQWEPVPLAAAFSASGHSGAVTAQSGEYSFPQISGTAGIGQLPALRDLSGTLGAPIVAKLQGRSMLAMTATPGQALVWDGMQWVPSTGMSPGIGSLNGRTGVVTTQTGDYAFLQILGAAASAQSLTAGGDLSVTLASATASKLLNRPLASTAPAMGEVLGRDARIRWWAGALRIRWIGRC